MADLMAVHWVRPMADQKAVHSVDHLAEHLVDSTVVL